MIQTNDHRWSVLATVPNPAKAAEWLADHLYCQIAPVDPSAGSQRIVESGNLRLILEAGPSVPVPAAPAGSYYSGLAHLALRTTDIDLALAACQAQGLTLILKEGGTFFNPKVYGNGTRYFHVVAPFGLTIEISQRLDDPSPYPEPIICGLCHLGVPAPDFKAELAFFETLGFQPDFDPVTNWNAAEGTIYCCMVSQLDPAGQPLTLEIYQLADLKPIRLPDDVALGGLSIGRPGRQSDAGVRLV
jgi:catechol 2,3-dioxygenase-like lactoylglutathione lyase family enzyme